MSRPSIVFFLFLFLKLVIVVDIECRSLPAWLVSCRTMLSAVVYPPMVWCRTWLSRMSLSPPTRMTELSDRLEEVHSRDATGPCGSFTFAYHCMCDYHGVTFSEEVAWVSTVRCRIKHVFLRAPFKNVCNWVCYTEDKSSRPIMGSLIITLLHIYCWVYWWKNFENRSIFEVTTKSLVAYFFWLRLAGLMDHMSAWDCIKM